jgi:hypothetical protein
MTRQWQKIETLPPPGERPGRVFVVIEGFKDHSGLSWYRQHAGLAYTYNHGITPETLRKLEKEGDMEVGTAVVTHWMPYDLPPYPERGT